MSIKESRAVFEAFKAASNERWLDPDATVSLYSEEGKRTAFGGREMLEVETAYRVAFPDWQREFSRVVIGEDGFACVSRIRATNTGRFMGGPATNRAIDVEGVSFFRVEAGFIAESVVVNQEAVGARMFEQLGLPNPAAPGAAARTMLERSYRALDTNPKDFSVISDLYAARFLLDGVVVGASAWRTGVEAMYAAFPDATHEVLDIAVDGEVVSNRYIMRGTHTGDLHFPGGVLAATGRPFEVRGFQVRRVRDDRFIELWNSDTLGQLLLQLRGEPK